MDASGGHSEDEVITCLRYLREERGPRPGSKRGPRHFSWFKTVVMDYSSQRLDREFVTGNAWGPSIGLSREEFDPMTEVLE
jgi:hypothetical protein